MTDQPRLFAAAKRKGRMIRAVERQARAIRAAEAFDATLGELWLAGVRQLAERWDAAHAAGESYHCANLARELREWLGAIGGPAGGSDPADEWLRALSAEMGDAAPT